MSAYSDVKMFERTNNDLSNGCQKKVLYFSDGTLEVDELSVDDAPKDENLSSENVQVNPQELRWIPWMWYQTTSAGSKALEVCDYLGESLASFFGITTPKYQFELNEYYRLKKEEEEEIRNDIEMGDWTKKFSSSEFPETEKCAISVKPKMCVRDNDNN